MVRTGRGRARVEQVIGPATRIENVLEGLLVETGARQRFEPHDAPEPSLDGRVDLRDLLTYTVDPDTAKDFDDALSFREEPDGIRAWVHIADVSYFVGAGTPLDHGAMERAFSTYVPGAVAPMLPHDLADDLCSLRPNEDRLCVTVELPPSGAPLFYRSVIRSDARLTYGQAERRDAPPAVLASLELNDRLATEWRAARFARGALQVQTPEEAFRFDGDGGVADAWLESEAHAHMLVEELMIRANEVVGELLSSRRREALYRVHERPDPQAVEHLLAKLADLGVPTPPAPKKLAPQEAAALAGAISERVAEYVAQSGRGRFAFPSLVLRALKRARYDPHNLGHSGPRQHGVLPLHVADPPLPRPDRAPGAAARARPGRRPAARGSPRASPSTRRSASARRRRSSTSPTRSASRGCSSGACTSRAGTRSGRGRSSA